MLYQWHECYRAWLAPLSDWSANMANSLKAHPDFAPKSIMAGFQLFHRIAKDYTKPQWEIPKLTSIEGITAHVNIKTIQHLPFCDLLHFEKIADDANQQLTLDQQKKLFICAPLSGHHATLLQDTVLTLLPHYQVFITDWLDARMVPLEEGDFNLDDYVHYLIQFMQTLGMENLHVLSVCQPTVPLLGAVSLLASQGLSTPASMILMGGPIDGRKSPTSVNHLALEKDLNWFKDELIYTVPKHYPGHGRRVYPGFLQFAGFISMNISRHVQSHWDYFLHLVKGDEEDADKHVRFYNQYNAVLDMSESYYLQTIEEVFKKFSLAKNEWVIRGEKVEPYKIQNTALFTIEGELDDISGLGQTFAAHDLCPNVWLKQHQEVEGAGHYGIFSGRRWRNHVAPLLHQFIEKVEKRH